MKLKMIKLTPEFITKTFRGKASCFISNLPEDTELLDIKYDLFSKQVYAVLRSDSFEDVAESCPIPEFNIVYSGSSKVEPQQVKNIKPEFRHSESVPIQTSHFTSALEKEFSPEQRKLLSFVADGEFLMIKPNQKLNTEWDEINDVVKSLGGKWVKGDFFSYWIIQMQKS